MQAEKISREGFVKAKIIHLNIDKGLFLRHLLIMKTKTRAWILGGLVAALVPGVHGLPFKQGVGEIFRTSDFRNPWKRRGDI
jgi:hypothetical protein